MLSPTARRSDTVNESGTTKVRSTATAGVAVSAIGALGFGIVPEVEFS